MDLGEFLLARIAEDEAELEAARRLGVPPIPTGSRITSGIGNHPTMSETRMAAECDAKRRIVAWDAEQPVDRNVLNIFAAPYRDHPDYDPAWEEWLH